MILNSNLRLSLFLSLTLNSNSNKLRIDVNLDIDNNINFEIDLNIDLDLNLDLSLNPKFDEKLLKLNVDTGLDNRIILSGIAKYYDPKDLINKQVMVIVNLEPRKMMGIDSEGMLLLAEDPDGSLKLMQPEDKITNGSIVC